MSSLTGSIAIPLILVINAFGSIIGEVGLGYDLFIRRSDLDDTGHFGEWPINAIGDILFVNEELVCARARAHALARFL